ncbi:MAG: hypothetical protein QM479_15135, partial [Pseudomonadota bacterium]
MNIKKIIKFSFLLIITLIVILATINSLVVIHLIDNHASNNKIHDLVSFQSGMAFLLKESIRTENLEELNTITKDFIRYEKQFETLKNELLNHRLDVLDFIIENIHFNPVIIHNLALLYENEKLLESSFSQAIELQKQRFELITLFKKDYPLEKNIRNRLEKKVIERQDMHMLLSFGNLKYYSKETLFQYKNQHYLNQWLNEADIIKSEFKVEGLEQYISVVKKVGSYILGIEKIKTQESTLENQILAILKSNQKVNSDIVKKITELSNSFVNIIYLTI